MTLAPDKIELAQQIADVLKEGINAGPWMFFGSTYTKSEYCKNLIKPLLKKYHTDTLLKSLPPHSAKSLKEKYSKLMFCFSDTGQRLNQGLSLKTIERHANDLIKELRDLEQEGKQNTTAAKQKNKRRSKKKPKKSRPIDKRFTFGPGQVLFDDRDLNAGTGAALDIAKALIENFSHIVPFQKLDENSAK